MRVIFAGTPEFARSALAALHAAGHDIVGVLTQPDRPAGRGMKLQASAVKQFAVSQGLTVVQPHSLKLDGKYPDEAQAAKAFIANAQADVMVVAAYGLILPQWVLDAPRYGCLNIHASLLPRWRGAAPIHRAVEAGDAETGVTIMQMDAGLDTGDMLLEEKCPITEQDTTASLHDKLAEVGARMIVNALLQAGHFKPVKQPLEGVTYAHKIEKSEAAIDWTEAAQVLAQRVRAFDPFPGMTMLCGDEVVKVWQAHAAPLPLDIAHQKAPGTLLSSHEEGLRVACGEGILCLTQLQKAGGKRQAAADFVRSFKGQVGDVFQS
ncbi:MAG: methionyl-tRNA formyltransferase [Betaproteobacteria bacterium]|jgi:methionyl-tRNA formyltransferase